MSMIKASKVSPASLIAGSVLSVIAIFAIVPAHAQVVDAANDFLATYTGPQNGDLDVLNSSVVFDGQNFILSATMNGTIGTTAGGFYVWGFDRGQGTARFAAALAGTDNTKFDSVVILRPDTTATVNRIVGGSVTNFATGKASINGASLIATIAASELPTEGLSFGDYTWNLWPRSSAAGGVAAISDFAPNSNNAGTVSAPEPAALPLVLLGMMGLPFLRRRK